MIKTIKKLFHKHDIVYTSRQLVGRETHSTSSAGIIDVQGVNVYLVHNYCVSCGKKFSGTERVLNVMDNAQPYDIK